MPTSLTDRVKRRVETDVGDEELGFMITDAQTEIRTRYGPDADSEHPITTDFPGRRRKLDLLRPIDTDEGVTVREFLAVWDSSESELDISDNDFRVWNGGRTLERLTSGSNPRRFWGDRVEVTYVPVSDQAQRDEATIKLVLLAIEYDGYAERTVGDVKSVHGRSQTGTTSTGFTEEREAILRSLAPRGGLLIR